MPPQGFSIVFFCCPLKRKQDSRIHATSLDITPPGRFQTYSYIVLHTYVLIC